MPHNDNNIPPLNIFLLNPMNDEDNEEEEVKKEEERQSKLLLFQILESLGEKIDNLPHAGHPGGSF